MIDAYLTGRLSPEDSARLMESIEQDPALKGEFLLQKDLVHSLQAHRRQELKARLNKIEVGPAYTMPSAIGFKIIAGAAVVALLGTGAYFAFTPDQPEASPESISIPAEQPKATEQEEVATETLPLNPESAPAEESIKPAPVAETESKEEQPTENSSLKSNTNTAAPEKPKAGPEEAKDTAPLPTLKEERAVADAEVVKPEVISFFDDGDAVGLTPEADAPEDRLSKIRSFNTQNIEVTTRTDTRYSFHYMFFDNQLYIYGDFSKVPYEVLEVNTGSGTSYYLYHSGRYFELNPNQRKVSKLRELKNEKIITELEITRKEKLNK